MSHQHANGQAVSHPHLRSLSIIKNTPMGDSSPKRDPPASRHPLSSNKRNTSTDSRLVLKDDNRHGDHEEVVIVVMAESVGVL